MQTLDAEVVTGDEILLHGEITELGEPAAEDHGFCVDLKTGSEFESEHCISLGSPEQTGPFEATFSEVVPGLGYRVRAFAETEGERIVGDVVEVLTTWKQLDHGENHTCGIAQDDTLWCWGSNEHGQLGLGGDADASNVPRKVDEGQWKHVAVGPEHTCAIDADDELWCWGEATLGRLGIGTLEEGVEQIPTPRRVGEEGDAWNTVSIGLRHTCAIDADDGLWCWGNNLFGILGLGENEDEVSTPQEVQPGNNWTDISSGRGHNCAIDGNQNLHCWGTHIHGQLGLGEEADFIVHQPAEVAVNEDWNWVSVSVGDGHTCAKDEQEVIRCWGENEHGQVGIDSEQEEIYVPRAIETESSWDWRSLSVGKDHGCAIRDDDGALFCWGAGAQGRLGVGDTDDRSTPTQAGLGTTWDGVSAGGEDTCALTENGELMCWGLNTPVQPQPVALDSDVTFDDITAGQSHGCGVTDDATYCWGTQDKFGGPSCFEGDDEIGAFEVPQLLDSADAEGKSISGTYHNCSLQSDGTLWCWGRGCNGQLGLGEMLYRNSPRQVTASPNLETWTALDTGQFHTCAIAEDDTLWCWGMNNEGRLATNSTDDRISEPEPVVGDHDWIDISGGQRHNCAIRLSDSSLWCWGLDTAQIGVLGLGDDEVGEPATQPQQVDQSMVWTSVSTYDEHTCAITDQNTLWCWGGGSSGQLGVGDTEGRTSPAPVEVEGVDWSVVTTGVTHTCAIDTDQRLWCWGRTLYGRLGVGDLENRLEPTLVDDTRQWSVVSAGRRHTHALETDGTAWTWGENVNGQLGDGSAWELESVAFLRQFQGVFGDGG